MTPDISTAIVGTQIALILLALAIGLIAKNRKATLGFAWACTVLSFGAIGLAGVAASAPAAAGGSVSRYVVYAVTSFIAAAVAWGVVAVVGVRIRSAEERYYAKPETREAMGAELREVLRTEGIALDERLKRAEAEREQFLYALEDQHARQIAGLAQEYQHEASTILRGLVDQLAAEKLEPMVEERLAKQRKQLERDLAGIDADEAAATVREISAQYAELEEEVSKASRRIERLRKENPDLDVEEQAERRLAHVDKVADEKVRELEGMISTRMEEVEEALAALTAEQAAAHAAQLAAFEAQTNERTEQLSGRLAHVDALLDAKIEEAGNPLLARLHETQGAVERQLSTWMGVLDNRFAETEGILNQRIIEQESALEGRVVELESAIEDRLGQHVTAVEQVLADHDGQLQAALTEQSTAIGAHFSRERDRLIAELTEHGVSIQETVANELMNAELRARETVDATQAAWNVFTDELETRFAETRAEAERAAREIAEEERESLRTQLNEITQGASSDIAQQVEQLGREAAWQRAQVERSVQDTLAVLHNRAQDAIGESERVFEDLERIGNDRVERIRRDAEDALVQSRDYVGSLKDSLGVHLEQLREHSGELAEEMNERLASITQASQQGASQLEQYARDLVDATTRQLASVGERATSELQARINDEFTASVQNAIAQQQRTSEAQLAELSQRAIQQVQGDLAGLAEHARAAVTGELDSIINDARRHAQESQEQAFRTVMGELARQQAELAEQARMAAGEANHELESGLRDGRRQLEEALASMTAHMREELVRFHDEGQRRVDSIISSLRSKEHELVREEDQRLTHARQELVRQHQGALEDQVRNMVGGLGRTLDVGVPTMGSHGATPATGAFTAGVERPSTPLSGGFGG